MTGAFPTVVCLTPVRNEAWILERFLARASTWADHIVVADQRSDDGSREIARLHPKVTLLEIETDVYDEGVQRQALVEAARRFPAPRVLVAIDADEALSPEVLTSATWRRALYSAPGTVMQLRWVNLLPGLIQAWIPTGCPSFAFVDDERPYDPQPMHAPRLPVRDDDPIVEIHDVVVLHYQYLDEQRMRAKQRWYQCLERVAFPGKRSAEIYRQYHHMDSRTPEEVRPVAPSWTNGHDDLEFQQGGEDVWHRRILKLMREHGAAAFRKVDIWDVDWASEAARLGVDVAPGLLSDPRSPLDRAVLRWLRFAQPRRGSVAIRTISRSLQAVGW